MLAFSKISLMGYVGRDPEIRDGEYGEFSTCSLGVTNRRKAGTNEETQWYSLLFNSYLTKIVREYVRKGSPIYVEGRPEFSVYISKDGGSVRVRVDVRVTEFQLLRSKKEEIEENEDSMVDSFRRKQRFDDSYRPRRVEKDYGPVYFEDSEPSYENDEPGYSESRKGRDDEPSYLEPRKEKEEYRSLTLEGFQLDKERVKLATESDYKPVAMEEFQRNKVRDTSLKFGDDEKKTPGDGTGLIDEVSGDRIPF